MFCPIKRRIISVKIGLFFQENIFRTEFTGSNFLLPTFFTGGQWYFQVANLLLATVNFKPCSHGLAMNGKRCIFDKAFIRRTMAVSSLSWLKDIQTTDLCLPYLYRQWVEDLGLERWQFPSHRSFCYPHHPRNYFPHPRWQ